MFTSILKASPVLGADVLGAESMYVVTLALMVTNGFVKLVAQHCLVVICLHKL